MVVLAPLPLFKYQQHLYSIYAQSINRIMSRDACGRPSTRHGHPRSGTSPSPGLREGHQSPFVPPISDDRGTGQPENPTMATHTEPMWVPGRYYQEAYPSPSITPWPQQYVVGAGTGEDHAAISGYASGPSTDADSTSGFDELIFQNQMNQFSGNFDEKHPLESMHGDGSPYIFDASHRIPFHTIPSHGQVPPSMIVPSTPMAPPVTQPSSRVTKPAVIAPAAIAPKPEASKGKKRVRSPSPEHLADGDLAHRMRKRQATDSSKVGPIRAKTVQPAGSSSDARSAEPLIERSDTPTAGGRIPDAVSSGQSRRQNEGRLQENARPPGACWRCRRYKKPVSALR